MLRSTDSIPTVSIPTVPRSIALTLADAKLNVASALHGAEDSAAVGMCREVLFAPCNALALPTVWGGVGWVL